MKYFGRILAAVCTLTIFLSAIPFFTFAAVNDNTGDTYHTIMINPSNFNSDLGQSRIKENATPIYYQGITCKDTHTYVAVFAFYNSNPTITYNVTTIDTNRVDHVLCRNRVQYSIGSRVNENGYKYAVLAFKRLPDDLSLTASTSLYYVWSPDSSGTYKPAT